METDKASTTKISQRFMISLRHIYRNIRKQADYRALTRNVEGSLSEEALRFC